MGEKKGFFSRLARGLSKTRENIVNGIDSIFKGFSSIDDDFYEELEEILIMGDIGIKTTSVIMDRLKHQGAGSVQKSSDQHYQRDHEDAGRRIPV